MATRLYPAGASTPITPAPGNAWEVTTSFNRAAASIDPADYAFYNLAGNGTGTANDDRLGLQLIYGPLAGGSISGTVKGQCLAREAAAGSDARTQALIRVIAPDGSTVRGTLLAFDTAALSSEFPVSTNVRTNRQVPRGGAVSLSAVTATAGDYLVIEAGWRNHGVNTGVVRVDYGSALPVTTDLPEDETTDSSAAIYRGWFEFSQTLALAGAGLVRAHGYIVG